jgi:hypothetical protein
MIHVGHASAVACLQFGWAALKKWKRIKDMADTFADGKASDFDAVV